MAREKYKTLTEQMFYILICLKEECCGIDIMDKVRTMTNGRIAIGAGTLYTLLGEFQKSGFIRETAVDGRKRSYIITAKGEVVLEAEYTRIVQLVADYEEFYRRV